jgi:hypothetical protein
MTIRLGSTVINCADMELMTGFWSRALGLVPSSSAAGDDFRVLRGAHANLDPEDDYVVMTDPEGNEFCVCAKADV